MSAFKWALGKGLKLIDKIGSTPEPVSVAPPVNEPIAEAPLQVPIVLQDWSIRSMSDGDFVTPYAVKVMDCFLFSGGLSRHEPMRTGKMIDFNYWTRTVEAEENGLRYQAKLGRVNKAYDDYLFSCRIAHPVVPIKI
jgi:hypothetical protein